MQAKIIKNLVALAMVVLVALPVFTVALTANAQGGNLWGGSPIETGFQTTTGLGNQDPRVMAGSVVKIMLGFLGIIAVMLILLAGFKWMTAAGNEDKVAEAKKLMGAGLIGLVIILMAFALAQFVINALYNATGATT